MAIRFTDIAKPPTTEAVLAADVAPLDSRIADKPLRKIPEALRKIEPNYRNAAKRGRPVTGEAMSNAERQRRYRERKKQSGG